MAEHVKEEPLASVWPCYPQEGFEKRPDFKGRLDTFGQIDSCFFSDEPTLGVIPCSCILGPSGVGKTRVAIQYAIENKEAFDAVFFVQSELPSKILRSFGKIASALGLMDSIGPEQQPSREPDHFLRRSRALKWLSSPEYSDVALSRRSAYFGAAVTRRVRWLLIFDDVLIPSLLQDYLPSGSFGRIIITSQRPINSNQLPSRIQVTRIHPNGLDIESGADLVLHLVPGCPAMEIADIRDSGRQIASKVRCFPLAIVLAAAYANRNNMTLTLLQTRITFTTLSETDGPDFQIYKFLPRWAITDLSPTAASLLRIYCFADPRGIQDSILRQAQTDVRPKNYPADVSEYDKAREELLQSSLITIDPDLNPDIVRMHRDVQNIVIHTMDCKINEHQRIKSLKFLAAAVSQAWPSTKQDGDDQFDLWSAQEALLDHIIQLTCLLNKYLNNLDGQIISERCKFVALLSKGVWCCQDRGDFITGSFLSGVASKICDNLPTTCSDLRSDVSFALGIAYRETKRWPEFLEQAQKLVDIRTRFDNRNVDTPTSYTAIAHSELGMAQTLMKQYEEGLASCNESLAIYEQQSEVLDGSFYPASPRIHRALALIGAGRPQEGEEGLLGIIAWHETHFGPADTEYTLGCTWHCLGLIYARSGRPKESFEAYSKAYAKFQASVGPVSHRTGNVCDKLAEHHESLHQFKDADRYYSEAEEAYKSQSHWKPELARHYFIKSGALWQRGDVEAAPSIHQEAHRLYAEIVPPAKHEHLSLDVFNGLVAPWVW